MNKSDIIDKIRTDAGLTIAQATMTLQAVEHGITEALAKGESVKIVGFGAFETAERKARVSIHAPARGATAHHLIDSLYSKKTTVFAND